MRNDEVVSGMGLRSRDAYRTKCSSEASTHEEVAKTCEGTSESKDSKLEYDSNFWVLSVFMLSHAMMDRMKLLARRMVIVCWPLDNRAVKIDIRTCPILRHDQSILTGPID